MKSIIERIRANPENSWIGKDTPIGVVGSFGKSVSVNTENGNRLLRVTATTDDIDLDTEVVVPAGAETDYFFANRKIFLDHNTDFASLVGRLRSASPLMVGGRQKGWGVNMHILDLKHTPYGDDILTVAREVGIGVSIGFIPLDHGRPTQEEVDLYTKAGKAPRSIVRRWKWVELSITAMPCNVACQSQDSWRVDESKVAELDRLLTKGMIRKETAHAFGLPAKPRRVLRCG